MVKIKNCPKLGVQGLQNSSNENLPHIMESSWKINHSCFVCGKTYNNIHALDLHVQTHTSDGKTYKCRLCFNRYKWKQNLIVHMRSHGINPIRCQYCPSIFRETRQYLRHTRNKHRVELTEFQCEVCLDVFSSYGQLFSHCNKKHNSGKEETAGSTQVVGLNSAGSSGGNSTKHRPIISTRPVFYKQNNNISNMSLVSDKELVVLIEKSPEAESLALNEIKNGVLDNEGNSTESRVDYYICQICGKELRSIERFILHKTKHPEITNFSYVCKVCEKTFASLRTLNIHVTMHTGVLPYSCNFCTQRFRTTTSLNKHKQQSHPAKVIQELGSKIKDPCFSKCSLCNEKIWSQPDFRRHKGRHRSETTPFKLVCVFDQCRRKFTNFYSARNHGYSHVNKKPSKCRYCGMEYSNPGSLFGHVRSFHREKLKYICKKCGVVFKSKLWYLKHRMMNCVLGKDGSIRKRRSDGRSMVQSISRRAFKTRARSMDSMSSLGTFSNDLRNSENNLDSMDYRQSKSDPSVFVKDFSAIKENASRSLDNTSNPGTMLNNSIAASRPKRKSKSGRPCPSSYYYYDDILPGFDEDSIYTFPQIESRERREDLSYPKKFSSSPWTRTKPRHREPLSTSPKTRRQSHQEDSSEPPNKSPEKENYSVTNDTLESPNKSPKANILHQEELQEFPNKAAETRNDLVQEESFELPNKTHRTRKQPHLEDSHEWQNKAKTRNHSVQEPEPSNKSPPKSGRQSPESAGRTWLRQMWLKPTSTPIQSRGKAPAPRSPSPTPNQSAAVGKLLPNVSSGLHGKSPTDRSRSRTPASRSRSPGQSSVTRSRNKSPVVTRTKRSRSEPPESRNTRSRSSSRSRSKEPGSSTRVLRSSSRPREEPSNSSDRRDAFRRARSKSPDLPLNSRLSRSKSPAPQFTSRRSRSKSRKISSNSPWLSGDLLRERSISPEPSLKSHYRGRKLSESSTKARMPRSNSPWPYNRSIRERSVSPPLQCSPSKRLRTNDPQTSNIRQVDTSSAPENVQTPLDLSVKSAVNPTSSEPARKNRRHIKPPSRYNPDVFVWTRPIPIVIQPRPDFPSREICPNIKGDTTLFTLLCDSVKIQEPAKSSKQSKSDKETESLKRNNQRQSKQRIQSPKDLPPEEPNSPPPTSLLHEEPILFINSEVTNSPPREVDPLSVSVISSECNIGKNTFESITELNIHTQKVHTTNTPENNEVIEISDESDMDSVIEIVQTDVVKNSINPNKEKIDIFRCETCNMEFATEVGLDQHKATHQNQIICPLCDHPFLTMRALKWHVESEHPETDNSLNKSNLQAASPKINHATKLGTDFGAKSPGRKRNREKSDNNSTAESNDKPKETKATVRNAKQRGKAMEIGYLKSPANSAGIEKFSNYTLKSSRKIATTDRNSPAKDVKQMPKLATRKNLPRKESSVLQRIEVSSPGLTNQRQHIHREQDAAAALMLQTQTGLTQICSKGPLKASSNGITVTRSRGRPKATSKGVTPSNDTTRMASSKDAHSVTASNDKDRMASSKGSQAASKGSVSVSSPGATPANDRSRMGSSKGAQTPSRGSASVSSPANDRSRMASSKGAQTPSRGSASVSSPSATPANDRSRMATSKGAQTPSRGSASVSSPGATKVAATKTPSRSPMRASPKGKNNNVPDTKVCEIDIDDCEASTPTREAEALPRSSQSPRARIGVQASPRSAPASITQSPKTNTMSPQSSATSNVSMSSANEIAGGKDTETGVSVQDQNAILAAAVNLKDLNVMDLEAEMRRRNLPAIAQLIRRLTTFLDVLPSGASEVVTAEIPAPLPEQTGEQNAGRRQMRKMAAPPTKYIQTRT